MWVRLHGNASISLGRLVVTMGAIFLALVLLFLWAVHIFGWTAIVQYVMSPGLNEDLDNLEKIATVVAIVIGGAWVYFNFSKGRIYKSRLEPRVSGTIMPADGITHLLVTITLKNIGLSKFDIQQEGTALQILSYDPLVDPFPAEKAGWKFLSIFTVFEQHAWIEPGETIEEQKLIVIQGVNHTAFRLELRVISRGFSWDSDSIIMVPKASEANSSKDLNYAEHTQAGRAHHQARRYQAVTRKPKSHRTNRA